MGVHSGTLRRLDLKGAAPSGAHSALAKRQMTTFTDLPVKIQEEIYFQAHKMKMSEVFKELEVEKNSLWSYYGRIAFVQAKWERLFDTDESSDSDYDPDNPYYDGEDGSFPECWLRTSSEMTPEELAGLSLVFK